MYSYIVLGTIPAGGWKRKLELTGNPLSQYANVLTPEYQFYMDVMRMNIFPRDFWEEFIEKLSYPGASIADKIVFREKAASLIMTHWNLSPDGLFWIYDGNTPYSAAQSGSVKLTLSDGTSQTVDAVQYQVNYTAAAMTAFYGLPGDLITDAMVSSYMKAYVNQTLPSPTLLNNITTVAPAQVTTGTAAQPVVDMSGQVVAVAPFLSVSGSTQINAGGKSPLIWIVAGAAALLMMRGR